MNEFGHGLTICLHRLKEFIKEHLVNIPTAAKPLPPQQPQPPPIATSDPGALLAGLL